MRNLVRSLAFAIAFLALVTAARAQSGLPPGVTAGPAAEGISEYSLANGLKVLLYPDPGKATITVNVTYLVGSRHENYGETGMAHLLEHLIFKGSRRIPEPDREFARRGFSSNGTTFFDRTNYFATFKADDDNLRWMLGWVADSMVDANIAKADLDSEMTVVRNEYELGENQPGSVLFKRIVSTAFDWHNYSNSPIGNRSDIENVPIERLQAFYRTYYQPDNAVLIVAGRFDPARTLDWIASAFGPIPRPTRTLPQSWTVEPTQDGERSVTVRRKGTAALVMVAYRIPAAMHPDTPALRVAADILGTGPNSRLHRALVETGLASSVSTSLLELRDPGLLLARASIKPGDSVDAAREKLIEVMESTFAATPPAAEELAHVRRLHENAFEEEFNDPESASYALSDAAAFGDWRLVLLSRDARASADAAMLRAATGRYLRRDNRTVGTFIPEDDARRAEIPAAPAAAERLQAYQPRAAVAMGETFDPSPANIASRTSVRRIGELDVALLPKRTRGESVDVRLSFNIGDERSLAGRAIAQQFALEMLERGTSRYTRSQFAEEKAKLKMSGSLLQFRTTRPHLAGALRLAAHAMRESSFPPAEFEQLRRSTLTRLQAALANPAAVAFDALSSQFNTYPAGDPRHAPSIAARIEAAQKVALEDVKAFHAELWGGSRGQIAVVGDFEPGEVEPLVRELFSGWHSKAPYAPVVRDFRPVSPTRIFRDVPETESASLRARIALDLRDDDDDFLPLMVADIIFGGGAGMSNRVMDRVRQREGLSYSAGSQLEAAYRGRASAWTVYGSFAPANAARFEIAVREELARLLKDGITPKELDDAVGGLLQDGVVERSQDNALSSRWVTLLDAGRDFSFVRAREERLRKLTVDEVMAAVRRHLDPARMTVVVAGDAAKGVK